MAQFTQPFTVTANAASVGPTASSNFLSVDFTATPSTGSQTISTDVWGSSMGAVPYNNWASLSSTTFQNQMKTIPLTFYRLNAVNSVVGSGGTAALMEATYASDGSLLTWQYIDNLINTWPLCFNNFGTNPPKLVLGMGAMPTRWNSAAIYGQVCANVAQHFKSQISNVTQSPLPIYGWEVGNETQDKLAFATYNQYFNAAADGYHGIDPTYVISGPVYNFFESTRYGGFVSSCNSHGPLMVSYHNYKFGGNNNPGDAAIVDMTVSPNPFRANNEAIGCRSTINSNGGNNNVPIFMGEWAQDDSPTDTLTDQSQQNWVGAVFNAQWLLDGLRSNSGVRYAAIWELFQDSDYGLIQGSNNPLPGGICPGGYLLAKATQTMWGTRVADSGVKTNNGGSSLNMLSVKDPATNRFAVMIINFNLNNDQTGQIALSHWPFNTTGNATITRWLINSANPTGATAALNVTAGLTASLTIPAGSVVILAP